MSFAIWLSFLSISLITAFSPGPAILLAMSNASQGAGKAMLSSTGNALGIFLVSGAAMIGLGASLRTSLLLFTVLKIAGALYLIYLGVKQWRGAGKAAPTTSQQPARPTASARQLFREGLLVALTNPKSIIFFTALFPQFIQTNAPIVPQFFVLTFTFVGCSLLSHATFVFIARRASARLTAGKKLRALQRASGALFMSLGVALLAVKRS
ncbi:lysine transporter LysE [Massilia eurypsychrophila]|uniref:Lysine transporter LysE n=1 Tax=Massilia eurypsychrophila TaxID=1485217 RepID=A0A2G8T8F3_9BURK|nr:LysE family transporter [Massilia eurypsychrophila]PIL42321.1 lysine transporter LysE [Massilia eurypsychrophila]